MLEDINKIKKDVQDYVETRLDLIRLHIAENLSRIISNAVTIVIIGYLLLLILMSVSFAASYFLAEQLQSNVMGFLCVAGFYLVLLIVFVLFRKQIVERPVIQAIIKLFFPKFNDDEKE